MSTSNTRTPYVYDITDQVLCMTLLVFSEQGRGKILTRRRRLENCGKFWDATFQANYNKGDLELLSVNFAIISNFQETFSNFPDFSLTFPDF